MRLVRSLVPVVVLHLTWLFAHDVHGFLHYPQNRRHAAASSSLALSSIPCNEGTLPVTRTFPPDGNHDETPKRHDYHLAYKLFRPMSLSSRQAAPVVVLHGGPSVPCDYLQPLVRAVPYRSILCYDQLGCGQSDEPEDAAAYSIDGAVQDLQALLKKLSVRRFHLYGQSFGGILAYEYLKQQNALDNKDCECLSVVLSSTPWNVKQVEQEADRLIQDLKSPDMFRETHQCRTTEMPEALATAYAKAGTVWRGTTAISDYQATPLQDKSSLPSCMAVRGEHDFVTAPCVEGWKGMFPRIRYRTLEGCSHHGLLENPTMYGQTLDAFFAEYD